MQDSIFNQHWYRWGIALILGFPLLTLILNEAMIQLRQQEKPLVETLRIIRNLLLPTLAILLLLTKVLEIEETNNLIRLLTTLFWTFVTHATLSGFKVLVFEEAAVGSWQSKVPGLLLDLIRFFLVACMTAIILSNVWKINLGGLLTALGVGSLVIGLAIQDALKNLFSGILLLFERPFSLGDWLKVGDTIGKVIQINWRSVYLQTRTLQMVVIPNSTLEQGNFTNLTRPTGVFFERLSFGFSYNDPPNKVKQVLLEIIQTTPEVLSEPKPWVRVAGYGDFTIDYDVAVPLNNYEAMPRIRHKIVARVWYAAKRYNLTIPFPIHTLYQYDASKLPQPNNSARITEIMKSLPHCGTLISQTIAETEEAIHLRNYAQGEHIFREGDRLSGIYLVVSGKVVITVQDKRNHQQEITILSVGEFFGVAGLLSGEESHVSAIAIDDAEVALLEPDIIYKMMERMPGLTSEFSQLLEIRREKAATAKNLQVN